MLATTTTTTTTTITTTTTTNQQPLIIICVPCLFLTSNLLRRSAEVLFNILKLLFAVYLWYGIGKKYLICRTRNSTKNNFWRNVIILLTCQWFSYCRGTNPFYYYFDFKKEVILRGSVMEIFAFLAVKCKLNTFCQTRNAPRTSRERNRMIFSKGEETMFSGDFSKKLRSNLKTLAYFFNLHCIFILALRSHTHLIILSKNCCSNFKRNRGSILGFL